MMAEADERAQIRLLKSIDDRLERIEDKLTRAELTFAGFLAGPGKKLMKLFGNGTEGR